MEENSVLKKSQGSQDMILTLFLQVIDVRDLSYKINDFRSVLTTRQFLLNTCWGCKSLKRKLFKMSWKAVLVKIEEQYEQWHKSFWQRSFRGFALTKVNRNFNNEIDGWIAGEKVVTNVVRVHTWMRRIGWEHRESVDKRIEVVWKKTMEKRMCLQWMRILLALLSFFRETRRRGEEEGRRGKEEHVRFFFRVKSSVSDSGYFLSHLPFSFLLSFFM